MAVCVKLIPEPYLPIELDPVTHRVKELGKMPFVVNPADLAALELAARVKEQVGGEVVTLTVGRFVQANAFSSSDITLAPEGIRDSAGRLRYPDPLRRCLATGADRAIVIGLNKLPGGQRTSFDSQELTEMPSGGFRPLNADSMMVARVLAQGIRRLDADLVFCGDRSYDQGNGLVGPALAELLDMPLITEALSATAKPGRSLLVRRRLQKGERELVKCGIPSVMTVATGSIIPRYYTMPRLIRAFRTGLEMFDVPSLGLTLSEISKTRSTRLLGLYPPRPRTRKFFIPPPELRARLMSGGMSQGEKKEKIIEGDPEQVATEMIQFLQGHEILPSG